MSLILTLSPVLGALAVGAISPGPSFVYVARTSVAGSRNKGIAAAAGMGLGAVIFAVLVMIGLRALLTQVAWLFLGLKLAGSAYLVYLGFALWRGARKPLDTSARGAQIDSALRAFTQALFTQLSNPKAVVIYGSIFAALLPRDLPRSAMFVLPFLVFAVEMGWYTIVALALSAPAPQRAYLRCRSIIDRFAGAVLMLLGLRLLLAKDPARF